jgi:site-specific DNA recombinase
LFEVPLASVDGVVEEFVDVESAKRSGGAAFTAMLEYLKKHSATCRTILVEKTDQGK